MRKFNRVLPLALVLLSTFSTGRSPALPDLAGTIATVKGTMITVKTKSGSVQIWLAKKCDITIAESMGKHAKDTVLVRVPRSNLVPGAKVFMLGTDLRQRNGSFVAERMTITLRAHGRRSFSEGGSASSASPREIPKAK